MKFTLVIVLSLLCSSLNAQILIQETDYHLPKESYLKTTLYNSAVGTPNGSWLHVKLPPAKRYLKGYQKYSRMSFRFVEHKESRDLVFLLTGLGSSVKAGYANYYARQLEKRGYNVIILPSIFTPSFLICLSDNGIVGEMAKDAEDYYRLMIRSKEYMEKNHHKTFNRVHVMGYSLGALTASFVGKIDQREKKLNITKNILINPPVDLAYGMKKIDSFVRSEERLTSFQYYKRFLKLAKNAITFRYYVLSINHYKNYMSRLQFSDTTLKAIVGNYLSDILPSILKTAEAIVWYEERLPLLDPLLHIKDYGYYDYLEKIVLKYRNFDPAVTVTMDELNDENSLRATEIYLKTNPNVFIFHNIDDFLLRSIDVDYMKEIMGERLTLYPYGGHLGNLWYPENLDRITKILNE